MDYTVVPMDRSHIKQIAQLEKLAFSLPWSEEMLIEELYDPQASFLVAERGEGEVLGYAGLHVVLDEGYIDNVAVFPQHRRQGVAGALVDVYCRFGAAHLAFLTLEVRASNHSAIALYRSCGFEEVGRRPGFYDEPKEDALIMTRRFRGEEEKG